MRGSSLAEALAAAFFIFLVALVFQQIATSLSAQGIASGGPLDDAAAYPRAVAIAILALLIVRLVQFRIAPPGNDQAVAWRTLRRPVALILTFALYLVGLSSVGYLFATPVMIVVTMRVCGHRGVLVPIATGVIATLAVSLLFQEFLNVVLPRGSLGLTPDWL